MTLSKKININGLLITSLMVALSLHVNAQKPLVIKEQGSFAVGGTVITNAGYGIGSSFETVKQLCPNSTVLEGYSTKGGVERDGILFVMEGEKEVEVQQQVKVWLLKIGLLKG